MNQLKKSSARTDVLKNPKAISSLIAVVILAGCCVIGFASRLFAVIRFESIIHEFDPWFNYRATHRLDTFGFYDFLNWFDERAWYPLGRIVGGTVYPGLMVTSGLISYFLKFLHITVHIRDICVFLAPLFSGLTCISTFLLTKEIWSKGAGLYAAIFISIVPGYISRSVAGSYDNEGIAIFALQFTFFLWIKALKRGSVFWACCTALSYFYMVSAWGGYVFIINIIPLHCLLLILLQRYSYRMYVAYTSFFMLGLLLSMQIPFVGFQPIKTSEHLAAAGIFVVIQALAALDFFKSRMTNDNFKKLVGFSLLIMFILGLLIVMGLTYAGYVAPWTGRFYSLWDTGYAKIHIPIIASVSEHQPTTWSSFFFDLHILAAAFPAGVYFCIKKINDERVFLIAYAVTASYFAGVMVRLMLTLTPCVCMLAGIVFSNTVGHFVKDEEESVTKSSENISSSQNIQVNEVQSTGEEAKLYDKAENLKKSNIKKQVRSNQTISSKKAKSKQDHEPLILSPNTKMMAMLMTMLISLLFVCHCTWVTSNAYSSPSVVLSSHNNDGTRNILDDFREAYRWLNQNTEDSATVMSWWDYGYQIAGMANRTTIVDNNTWNNSHIALVGKAMASTEDKSIEIMRELNVDYVLVIFGGMIGYSGDDINKFLWMVRIAEGEHPKDIKESNYYTSNGEFRVDAGGSKTLLNSLMYKMCYYRFGELQLDYHHPSGYDRTRNVEIGNKDISFEHLEEAYTTEHWLVRIYRVKREANKVRLNNKPVSKKYKKKYVSKKTSRRKRGAIRNKPVTKKGLRSRRLSIKKKRKSTKK